jgi:GGDEF domain-containing protein
MKHPAPGGAAVGGSLARVQVAVERLRNSGIMQAAVSAGIATFPEDGEDASELLRLSGRRMYRQKQEHRAAHRT